MSKYNIEKWDQYKIYREHYPVLFNGQLFFSIKKNSGFPPLDYLNIYWANNDRFIWKPTTVDLSKSLYFNNKLVNLIGPVGASLIKADENKSSFTMLELVFSKRSSAEAKSIAAFLESKNGNISFPFLYQGEEKYFVCSSYNLEYVSKENNTVKAKFEEIIHES